mgnify:FL=1
MGDIETLRALFDAAEERRTFLYMEACGGHGRNGYDAWQQSGTGGRTYNGLPWYWDTNARPGTIMLK